MRKDFKPFFFIVWESFQWASHSHHIHDHAYCICNPPPPFGFQWSNISYAFSRCMLLKSSDMYFEYSKCWTFCEFLIYVYEWLLFSLPWQRSVIFSPLQIVLMMKNEPVLFSLLYNTATCFVLYSSDWHSVKFYCYIITIYAKLTA